MILRNSVSRHGRKAWAACPTSSRLRFLSADTTPTTTLDPLVEGATSQTPVPELSSATLPSSSRWQPSTALAAKVSRTQSSAWSAESTPRRAASKIPEEFKVFNFIQKQTSSLGSRVDFRYDTDAMLKDPPQEATLELLMANQTHMGHSTSRWNPANSRYIYGEREGIYIISLEQTSSHLRRAARVVEGVAYYGGLILFVGTRKGHMQIVSRAAELARGCHLFGKWVPGTITNRDQILANMELKIVDELDRPVDGFEGHLLDRRPIVPDLVVCLNPLENYPMLRECSQENIPTIGIIDTNADPGMVTYPIPANDDSLRAATLIAGVLGRAGERGQARRLKQAEQGDSTWETPTEIQRFLTIQAELQAAEEEAALEAATAEDPAERDIPGMMNEAQLEAFQLLQEMERERRSARRATTKPDTKESPI